MQIRVSANISYEVSPELIPSCTERDCFLYSPFAVAKCGICQEKEKNHEQINIVSWRFH
jgi:hypothetical protein